MQGIQDMAFKGEKKDINRIRPIIEEKYQRRLIIKQRPDLSESDMKNLIVGRSEMYFDLEIFLGEPIMPKEHKHLKTFFDELE